MTTRTKVVALGITSSSFLGGLVFAYQINFGSLVATDAHEDNVSFGGSKRSTLLRHEIQIPKAYGSLVTITGLDERTVLWFESTDGLIRNVEVDGTVPTLVKRMGELN